MQGFGPLALPQGGHGRVRTGRKTSHTLELELALELELELDLERCKLELELELEPFPKLMV